MDAERIARNDATFRQANEEIERAAEPLGIEPIPFLCECADERCTEIVSLTLAQYEVIRDEPRWFLNVPGHEQPSRPHVRVVADCGEYLVVEKVGRAGEIVEQLDTRASADG
jgi:hypothetical protein